MRSDVAVSLLDFGEDVARQLEEIYSKRDVTRRRALARAALGAQPGERIIDVGCGPGFFVSELLDEVGPEGTVTGIDNSPEMLAFAGRRTEGVPNVGLLKGDAVSVPAPDGSYDRAICVQVLEYVEDVARALGELHRVLRSGGRVVVWDVDWATLSWHSSDQTRMGRVLKAWDRHLVHPSLPRTLTAMLRGAGFEEIRVEGHAFPTNELSDETYGGAFLSVIEDFVRGLDDFPSEELDAWAVEQRELGARGEYFFAVMQFCFAATKPR